LKSIIVPWQTINLSIENLGGYIELLSVEEDHDLEEEFKKELKTIEKRLHQEEIKIYFSAKEDFSNVFFSINSGAGGTESCDWVNMLYRMYSRWAEDKGFSCEIIDKLSGDEVGLKNTMLLIKGDYAYGLLKSEIGVHRLVRISPFDSNKRRHTTFASVDVIPAIEEDIDIVINDVDLKIDTYRASGSGGQHVNVTDSAVRITHLPTGIVVQCQNERSQHKNKDFAMKVLKSRLHELERKKREQETNKAYGEKDEIAWGSQIRSYVFHPYSMVKDHRTKAETSNVGSVMDGSIDLFIETYLKRL